VISGLTDAVRGMLDESQLARWDVASDVGSRLLRGDQSIGDIGLSTNGDRSKDDGEIYDQWNWAYGFDDSQQPFVRNVASSYSRDADQLLRDWGQYGPNPRPLSAAEQARMQDEFFALQFRMEREFQHLLTSEQRDAMRRRPPAVIRFHFGDSSSTNRNTGNSF
jgi:hypothetical protein